MYNSNLAMAVKVDGKVLRETNGTVYLPFGSEYSIQFKNTSSKRCRIKITVDGTDIMGGQNLVVAANSSSTVSRFIKNGNLYEGNSLKFIEKTEAISAHRGDKIEDGLIVVTYEFEKEIPYVSMNYLSTMADSAPLQGTLSHTGGSHAWRGFIPKSVPQALACNTAGITAPGSHNTQKFHSTTWRGNDGTGSRTMILQLKGEVDVVEEARKIFYVDLPDTSVEEAEQKLRELMLSRRVQHIVGTKEKIQCSMCGTKHKSSAKFCSECGTALKIYG